MIRTQNLTYNYDSKFSALYDVNLNIDKNTIILADELSSKTLLRLLSKQDTDYQGNIFIDNINLKEIKLKDISISYITNPTFLLKNKSISYNIAYPLIVRKSNKKEALYKATLLMNEYKIDEKKIKSSSHFEKVLISLLRTNIRHPHIVLIDDIFNNLSAEELKITINLINEISKESLTIITLNNDNFLDKFNDFEVIKLFNGKLED